MSKIDAELLELIESFVEQLTSLVQRRALESVQSALHGGALPSRTGSKFGRSALGTPGYESSTKRSPAELAELIKKLHAYIAKNPGLRIEKIGAGLGLPTKALVLPIRRLISDKKVSTKGQKRATVYFAR